MPSLELFCKYNALIRIIGYLAWDFQGFIIAMISTGTQKLRRGRLT